MQSLEDRMKGYENIWRTAMPKRLPVAVRVDGRAFHTFTRGMDKPYDEILAKSMEATLLALCKEIEGAVIGYWQSDEITIILRNDQTFETQAWFDNSVQKCASMAAAIATRAFNRAFLELSEPQAEKYAKQRKTLALFDARVFILPKEEACNCLLWRQQDAIRNSIEGTAQANFPQKAINGLDCEALKAKLSKEKGIDWDTLPPVRKWGECALKEDAEIDDGKGGKTIRKKWSLDGGKTLFSKSQDAIASLLS
jgi:tRNA(His) guanylyltransferase